MRKVLTALAVFFLLAPVGAQGLTDILYWGYGGITRAKEWVGPDGRLSQATQMGGQPSAFDIWPSMNGYPTEHARAEITLHRQLWSDPCQERLSLAAMAATDYRISIERSAQCITPVYGLQVCFDNPIPGGPANCRLWVRPDGLYTSDDGVNWRRL